MTDTTLPEAGTLWRAKDGRLMSLNKWLPDRAEPTALMCVLTHTPNMRRHTEMAAHRFGKFLQPEEISNGQ